MNADNKRFIKQFVMDRLWSDIEDALAQQIEQQRAPKTSTGLPWS